MFNVNNAPVTLSELQRFVAVVSVEIDGQPLDPRHDALILAFYDRGSVTMFSTLDPGHPSSVAQIDQLLATRRRMLAMVSPILFTPDGSAPSREAWVLVAVGLGGGPPVVAVRRIVEDDQWMQAPPDALPWFALSTAASLRAALENGTPLRLKQAAAPELYRRPDEVPEPPLDERGEL